MKNLYIAMLAHNLDNFLLTRIIYKMFDIGSVPVYISILVG